MTGNARSGVTVTVSSSPNVLIRVMHISRGRPLISALHDPHLPALQFHRTARSPAWVACTAPPGGELPRVGRLHRGDDVENPFSLVDPHRVGLQAPAGCVPPPYPE